ncbi:MAG: MarC family protein [Flaviflexus sp.]|nr:MarC family protein [Flaviflexus sp.]
MSNVVDLTLFASTFFTIFVIMDPPGNLPIFLALTSKLTPQERARAAWQATAVSFGVLSAFGAFGSYILGFLHISVEAMQLSGGLLLLLVAMQLLTGEEEDPGDASGTTNVALVPLGMPLLAGPGTIVAVMLSVEQASGEMSKLIAVIAAFVAVHIVEWTTLRFSVIFHRILGEGGVIMLTKLSGMLLAAIATQLMVNAVLAIVASM